MSIKSDKWIRKMSLENGMIHPFEPNQVRQANDQKIISYGTKQLPKFVVRHSKTQIN